MTDKKMPEVDNRYKHKKYGENLEDLNEEELMNIIDEEIDKSREDRPTVKENLTVDKVRVALDGLKDILAKRVSLRDANKCFKFSIEGMDKRAKYLRKKEELDFEFEEKVQNLVDALNDSNMPEKADSGIVEDVSSVDLSSSYCPTCLNNCAKVTFSSGNRAYLCESCSKSNEEKPKSIWKSVEELPKQLDNVGADIPCYILDGQGYYRFGLFSVKNFYEHNGRLIEFGKLHEPVKYCTLTDFINDYEQLKEIIKKLEEK